MASLVVIRIIRINNAEFPGTRLGFPALLLPTVSRGHWHPDLNQCDGTPQLPPHRALQRGIRGLENILLINSKLSSKKATTLQTVKVPRSNVLDRVQSFLPQMAQANDELKRKMVTAPTHQFDIEHLDSETEEVIEMNVAVVELSDSDTDEESLTSEDDSESDEDDSVTDEVTVDNIKFPKQKGEKGKIEILDSKANE
ncbi:NOP protein chaperone 1 isoform X1 [Molothrus ater]|uniref:NOP protein chaperone 1 isoform X1 n=1 Tax=Molothrus ater TaxID=84834 RepID=UPI00174B1B7A|nr:NOP protein chaperone 1 isoform X1 [Molothrus ater]